MDRKFLFFDIDGTLACGVPGNQYIPESTTLALRKLREAGHFLSIATGRSQAMAVDYMRQLGFHNMVSDGGYGVTIDDELLGITPLDRELCIELVDECIAKDFAWALQVENSTTRFAPDGRFLRESKDVYMETHVVPGLDPRDWPEIYKVYVACEEPRERQLSMLEKLPWCRFHDTYLFVEPADKSFGIKRIVDHEGGDYTDVIVFGDAKNDLTMFIPEWTSVAMGNACDELKAKASYITSPIDEDGIYRACEHFHLFDGV